jgi:nucleoside-diphosphate-sugar epimerase
MKIAVVGGSGFLGQQIVAALKLNNFDVACLHRKPHSQCHQISNFDLFEPGNLENFLELFQPDVLIITAWVTDLADYKISPLNDRYSLAIEVLARKLLARKKYHLIVLGSSAEYGSEQGPCASNVTTPIANDSYSKAKLHSLQILSELFDNSSSRLTWIRIFQPYGVNQDPLRLLPMAIRHFRKNRPFVLQSPNSVSDWISSRDVAAAVVFCISNKTPQIVDLGTGIPTVNSELLNFLRLKLNVPEELLILGRESKTTSRYLDIQNSSLHSAGWMSRDNLDTGIDWILESCE